MKNFPLTSDQRNELMAWRAEALERMPYMASILMALRPVSTPGLGTVACDRFYRLYVDFEAMTKFGVSNCAEALLHECFHLFSHDAERAEEHHVPHHDAMTFNVAADCANNDDLVEAGCLWLGDFGMTPSKIGARDHLTAEEYYEHLKETDDGSPDSGDNGQGTGDGDDDGSGSDGQANWSGCGSASGGEKAPSELSENDDLGGAAPAASEVERELADVATAANIREYASKHAGSVPGGILERAEQVMRPSEVRWQKVLSSAVRRSVASRLGTDDVTYSRRNRRQSNREVAGGRVIQPGLVSPVPSIVVVRDTSRSMSKDELDIVTSEVEGIARQLGIRGKELIVLDVDTNVAAARQYRSSSDLAEIAGRGGTDMGAGIIAASELRPKPSAIVVITDGYTPWPEVSVGVSTVACVITNDDLTSPLLTNIPKWIRAVKVKL